MIELEKEVSDGVAVIRPRGRLDMVAAPQLRALLDATVGDGVTSLVVDFVETAFIDSTGLGAVISGLKSARQAGGDLKIARVTGQVGVVLQLTNLDRVFRSYPTVEEALGAAR